jgi:hypothetical protein
MPRAAAGPLDHPEGIAAVAGGAAQKPAKPEPAVLPPLSDPWHADSGADAPAPVHAVIPSGKGTQVVEAKKPAPAPAAITAKQEPPGAKPASAPPVDTRDTRELTATLQDHLLPSRREMAAEGLSAMDWQTHPEVVSALVQAAREDPAATVRAACVRCLARMNVRTDPVMSALQALKADPDPRVRHELEACE